MNLKDFQPNYTMRDMVKVLGRVAELTRENNRLREQLESATRQLEQERKEKADVTAQLYELQGDFVRQMTTARVLPLSDAGSKSACTG